MPDHTPDRMGEDTFGLMAQRGVEITERAILEEMGGSVDEENDTWIIPIGDLNIPVGEKL